MTKTRRRRKSRNRSELILNIIWALAFLTFLGSAGALLWYTWLSGTEKAANNALTQTIEAAIADTTAPGQTPEEKRFAAYATLAQQNSDMVGWLTIPGTNVNYPVMHTPNSPEYYLRRGFDKNYALSGTLFLDAQSDIATRGDNKIIYGHNMKNSTMFSIVQDYMKPEYFAAHPTLVLDTLTERHEYAVAAVLHLDVTQENPASLIPYQTLRDADDAVWSLYAETVHTQRLYDTGVSIAPGDTLVSLSTCDNIKDEGRILLIAKQTS